MFKFKKLAVTKNTESDNIKTPLYASSVPAGFPSPADDYLESYIDLNEVIVGNQAATFFVKVDGDSMVGAGIFAGDMLVVDRSLSASHGRVVVALVEGEFTVKRFVRIRGRTYLYPENKKYTPIDVTEIEEFMVWGVVTTVIHKV
jgi:DNA polymerase V